MSLEPPRGVVAARVFGKPPGAVRAPAKRDPRGGFRVRRGQATLELLVVVVIVLGIATGVARLAGRELVRAQAEHAIDRGLQAEVAGDGVPEEAALAALPVVLRRSANVGVAGRSLTLTVDPPGPIGRVRITAPSIGGP